MGKEKLSGIDIGDRISFVGDSTGVETDPWPNGPASDNSDNNHGVVLPSHVAAMDAQLARRFPNSRWTKPEEPRT